MRVTCAAGALALLLLPAGVVLAAPESPVAQLNGFVLDPKTLDPAEIIQGGPPRDGIPALDQPLHIPASEAKWSDDAPILGVLWKGQARAYPIAILEWHELVNDTLGERDILVSYCPLCATGIVFDRSIAGKTRRFGVSGLLYHSDMLLFDRETESLWSQIASAAVTGPSQGLRLDTIRSRMELWAQWRKRYPNTTVLSPETGHRRNYGVSPYGDYALTEKLVFPSPEDDRYHSKMPTVGLRIAAGAARAYPAAEIVAAGGRVEETFEGYRIAISYDPENQVFDVTAPEPIEVIEGFWFAWAAFHPETTLFLAPGSQP